MKKQTNKQTSQFTYWMISYQMKKPSFVLTCQDLSAYQANRDTCISHFFVFILKSHLKHPKFPGREFKIASVTTHFLDTASVVIWFWLRPCMYSRFSPEPKLSPSLSCLKNPCNTLSCPFNTARLLWPFRATQD